MEPTNASNTTINTANATLPGNGAPSLTHFWGGTANFSLFENWTMFFLGNETAKFSLFGNDTDNFTLFGNDTAKFILFGDGNLVNQNASRALTKSTSVPRSWVSYTVVTLACIFLVVGLIGNGLALVVTLKSKTRFKPHNILIMSLAVADTCSLLTTTVTIREFGEVSPVDMIVLKSTNNFTCKLFQAAYLTSLFNSTLMIMLICIERFIVVWFPLKTRYFLTKRLTIISVATCVTVTIAFGAVPSVIYGGVRNRTCVFNLDVNGDGEADTIKSTPLLLVIPLLFVVTPMVVILSLTPLTIVKLYRQQAIRRSLTNQDTSTGSHRTSVLLTAIVVVYLLLVGIPHLTFSAISVGGTNVASSNGSSWKAVARICLTIITQANYSTNFIMYTWLNAEFRQNLFNMFSCSCCWH